MQSKQLGELSQLAIAAELAKAGWSILMPYGDSSRYDLVIDGPNGFKKVQCKTGRLNSDKTAIVFNAYSGGSSKKGGPKKGYFGDVDFFAVYCPDINKAYLVPMNERLPSSVITLRLKHGKNNQTIGIRMAEDFEIKMVDIKRGIAAKVFREKTRSCQGISTHPCPQCQKIFKPFKNDQVFCSSSCAQFSTRRIVLPDDQLLERLRTISAEKLGLELGVSGNAIRKRVKRIKALTSVDP